MRGDEPCLGFDAVIDSVSHMRGDEPAVLTNAYPNRVFPTCVGMNRYLGKHTDTGCVSHMRGDEPSINGQRSDSNVFPTCVGMNRIHAINELYGVSHMRGDEPHRCRSATIA